MPHNYTFGKAEKPEDPSEHWGQARVMSPQTTRALIELSQISSLEDLRRINQQQRRDEGWSEKIVDASSIIYGDLLK
jgi:hypothetical protein